MQVYTGDFFKEPSPDSETAAVVDESYCGFGVSEVAEELTGFGKPVNRGQTRSDYWDIPPVLYVHSLQLSSDNNGQCDHSPGKPGKVREFKSGWGKVSGCPEW